MPVEKIQFGHKINNFYLSLKNINNFISLEKLEEEKTRVCYKTFDGYNLIMIGIYFKCKNLVHI